MRLTLLDWSIIAGYFAVNLLIGLWYRRRATGSTEEYFVSGRNVSWWLAGTSMVATTFAADTPLAVTGLVASYGIAGNWLWWNMLLSNMLTVFFFARLWRRAGVVTDVELTELRYGGKPAAFLRGFRALYLGLPINCIILGWVNLAMVKILMMIFPNLQFPALGIADSKIAALSLVFVLMLITALISTLSGLWGVLVTDLFQFVLKMGMVIVLACFAVRAVGGLDALQAKLLALDAARGGHGSILSFMPEIGSAWMPMLAFFTYLFVNWLRGTRAPNPEAADSWRSEFFARKTRNTPSWPRSGSAWHITRCALGPGFSPRWPRWCSTRPWPTRNPVSSKPWWTPRCSRQCWQG